MSRLINRINERVLDDKLQKELDEEKERGNMKIRQSRLNYYRTLVEKKMELRPPGFYKLLTCK